MRLEGKQIDEYRLDRLIGREGTGEVYLSTDPRIQRQVAVKVLQSETSLSSSSPASASERFRREASVAAGLKHPHIVPLYDFNETNVDGTTIFYLVMPFYKEGSLTGWLQQHLSGLLPLDTVIYFMQQAADALQYAHNRQVIHGDVKPSNFLVDTSGNPDRPNLLLTDFSVSAFVASSLSGWQSFGTPTYMAPEQLDGRGISPASDQYSLAILAYELLTGRPPFQGPPVALIRQQVSEQPAPPSKVNPQLPWVVNNVILRTLDKKPENRYPTVTEFARALQRALQPVRKVGPDVSRPAPIDRPGGTREPQRGSGQREPVPGREIASNPNPYPSNTRNLALLDPLNDNSRGYKWDSTPGASEFRGGLHVIEQKQGSFYACYANALNFSNFTFEIQMTMLKGDCGGIIIRADRAAHTFYLFRVCTNGRYKFIRYVDFTGGNAKDLASGAVHPSIKTSLNAVITIAVVAEGSSFHLYLNRMEILPAINDSAYNQGKIAVFANASTHPTEVVFSNARVWV